MTSHDLKSISDEDLFRDLDACVRGFRKAVEELEMAERRPYRMEVRALGELLGTMSVLAEAVYRVRKQ